MDAYNPIRDWLLSEIEGLREAAKANPRWKAAIGFSSTGASLEYRRLILSRGTAFHGSTPAATIRVCKVFARVIRPQPANCFCNAQTFALHFKAGEYWEGFAVCEDLSEVFLHAWNVYRGKVVDFTLEASARRCIKLCGTPPDVTKTEYFGVRIPQKEMAKRLCITDTHMPLLLVTTNQKGKKR